jgi:flagellar hook-associated protein 1 FlgK
MAITTIFDISQKALLNNQSAIDTTAKNIANVNTEGYKRRQVKNYSISGFGYLSGTMGQEEFTRIRNGFVDNRLRMEQDNLEKYETSQRVFTNIESILGEPSDSALQNVMMEFWNSWNDLANDPENSSAKTVVKDKAVLLTNTFNRIYSDYQNLQEQIGYDINDKVKQINQLIGQIDSINDRLGSNSTADLLDQRDALIDELSTLMNIDIHEYENNSISLSVGGHILVSDNYATEIEPSVSYENGFSNYQLTVAGGSKSISVEGGSLGALLEINNNNIPDYISQLDTLAISLANRVNQLHSLGYNSNGESGTHFFSRNIQGANDFSVDKDIINDPSKIATAQSSGASGDNAIALAICDVQHERLLNGMTLSDSYSALVGEIGSQLRESTFLVDSQTMVVENLKNQRDAISGVSLDEELTRLIEFENAYRAASRLIETADMMIESLLQSV